MLSVNLDDATGYGRIVRDADGQVSAIVEHKDASPEQLQIREVNSGLMAAPAGRLREWLLGLGRNNSQREYYLTDVVAGAVQAGDRVEAVRDAARRRSHWASTTRSSSRKSRRCIGANGRRS